MLACVILIPKKKVRKKMTLASSQDHNNRFQRTLEDEARRKGNMRGVGDEASTMEEVFINGRGGYDGCPYRDKGEAGLPGQTRLI